MDQFFETISDETPAPPVSASAFCQARKKLNYEAPVRMNDVLIEKASKQVKQKRWHGFRVLAVDGSTGRLLNTKAIDQYFGRPSNSGIPLARFSWLYDVLNHLVVQADMAPYSTGERELAAHYLLDLKEEENYKREKQRMEIEHFSGRSALVLLQDFQAKIFAQNLADERYRERKHVYHINFANALSKMKNTIVHLFLLSSPLDLCWRVVYRIALSVEAVRPDRSYPRDLKNVRVPGFQDNYKRTR